MSKMRMPLVAALLAGAMAGCAPDAAEPPGAADPDAMAVEAISEPVPEQVLESQTGEATFYADVLQLKLTASGEPLDQNKMVAAHRRYPFGTVLRVTNLDNDRVVTVRVIDRGPFGAAKRAKEKVIDLSRRAADELGFLAEGRALVRIDVLEFGDGLARSDG